MRLSELLGLRWRNVNERLQEAGEAPLPTLSSHSMRRTFASVMFALGEPSPVVMADGGWAEPKTPLTVYGHAMRRDEGENDRLRALVEGAQIEALGTSAHLEAESNPQHVADSEAVSRS